MALKRLPCQRLVISSVSFSVGLPDTVTNIMRVFPFFVIFSMLSGLPGSTCEKSIGAEGLLCSGRSPSSMSSSFCQEGKSVNHQKAAFKWQRQEYPCMTSGAGLGPTLQQKGTAHFQLYLTFKPSLEFQAILTSCHSRSSITESPRVMGF